MPYLTGTHSPLFSGGLSAVQSDGAADWSWLVVCADVRLWAIVQTSCDLPSSTDIRDSNSA